MQIILRHCNELILDNKVVYQFKPKEKIVHEDAFDGVVLLLILLQS